MAAPSNLTYSQFHTKTGKGPEAYVRYVRYVGNFMANKTVADQTAGMKSFAPFTPARVAAQASRLTASQYDPMAARVNAQAQADVGNAGDVYTRYTGALGNLLAPAADQVKHDYADVGAGIAATAGALGTGSTQATQTLGDYLAKTGGSAPEAGLDTARAAAVRGLGMDALTNNIYQGGAATAFARSLPSLAALQGKEGLADYLTKREGDRASSLADIEDKRASTYADLLTHGQDTELQKAVAKATFVTNQGNTAENLLQDYLMTETARANRVASNVRAKAANATKVRTTTYKDPTTGQRIPNGYIRDKQGRVVKAPTRSSTPPKGTGPDYYTDAAGRRTPKGYRYNPHGELVKIGTPGSGTKSTALASKRASLQSTAVKGAGTTATNYFLYGQAVPTKTSGSSSQLPGLTIGPDGTLAPAKTATVPGSGQPTSATIARRYRQAYLAVYSQIDSSLPWLSAHEVEQLTRRALSTGGFPLFKTSRRGGPLPRGA